MGTEVCLPQDLFAERRNNNRAPVSLRRQRNFPANGNLPNLVVNNRPLPINTFNNNNKKSPRSDKPKKSPNSAAVRRGTESHESMTSAKNRSPNPSPRPAARRNRPALKPIRLDAPVSDVANDVYAGSAFSLSPSPRSVPLPTFFSKKQTNETECCCDDSATRDLRRLLRLD